MVIQICYTDQKGRTEDSEMVIAKRARIMGEGKVAMNSLIERTCNINPKPSKVETTATKTGRDCGNQGVSRPLHHLGLPRRRHFGNKACGNGEVR